MVTKVTSLQRVRFDLITFVTLLTSFTRSKPLSPQPRVFRRSGGRHAPNVHCMASGHLLVIRGESAHPVHRKCLFESGSKFLHRPRRTDGPVQQSRRGASLRWNQKSPARRAV